MKREKKGFGDFYHNSNKETKVNQAFIKKITTITKVIGVIHIGLFGYQPNDESLKQLAILLCDRISKALQGGYKFTSVECGSLVFNINMHWFCSGANEGTAFRNISYSPRNNEAVNRTQVALAKGFAEAAVGGVA